MNCFRMLFLVLSVAITGCSATGPVFKQADPPAPSKALLYIYRPETFAMSARTASFEIDGHKVVELKNKGYTTMILDPGQHKVRQSWNYWLFDTNAMQRPLEIEVNLKQGEQHFIRLASAAGPGGYQTLKLTWELSEVEPSFGMKEISASVFQPNTYQP